MASPTPLEIAMRQRAAEQERVLENPGALAQGFANAPGTAYRYLLTRGLPGIGQDVVSMGKMVGSAVAEDPMGFAADALFAPLSAVRDVSEVRALARQAREAGDDETADQMEQLAAMSVFGAIPIAGAAVKRGVGAAAKKASLAAKPAKAAAKKASLAVFPKAGLEGADSLPNQIRKNKTTTLSSQRYLDNDLVSAKLGAGDFAVAVSPVFNIDGKTYRTVLDGHHSLAAAKKAGVAPDFVEHSAADNDAIGLLNAGRLEDFLRATRMDSDLYDVDTGLDF